MISNDLSHAPRHTTTEKSIRLTTGHARHSQNTFNASPPAGGHEAGCIYFINGKKLGDDDGACCFRFTGFRLTEDQRMMLCYQKEGAGLRAEIQP